MEGDRFHKIFHFPNDYGASVVNNPKLKGYNNEGYRVLTIQFDSPEDYSVVDMPIFEKSTVDCKTWEDTVKVMTQIKDFKD